LLSSFASVYNTAISLGAIHFRYFNAGTFHSLLSVFTSNLIKVEIHLFGQKREHSITADDVVVKLFNLEQSSAFLQEIHRLQAVQVRGLIDEMLT
jgi:hypothetical protein